MLEFGLRPLPPLLVLLLVSLLAVSLPLVSWWIMLLVLFHSMRIFRIKSACSLPAYGCPVSVRVSLSPGVTAVRDVPPSIAASFDPVPELETDLKKLNAAGLNPQRVHLQTAFGVRDVAKLGVIADEVLQPVAQDFAYSINNKDVDNEN